MWNSYFALSQVTVFLQVPCLFKTHLHLTLSFFDTTKFRYDYSYAS